LPASIGIRPNGSRWKKQWNNSDPRIINDAGHWK